MGPGSWEGERRFALLVATTRYADPALRALRAPSADAIALRDLLDDSEVGGFSVTSVIDEKAPGIRLAIEDFLVDRSPDDVVLVYLSCHGLMDLRRRLYFAARDTLKNRLASSGVEAHWLLEQLEDCRARRQVVILDCCFSGAFAQGSKGDDDLGLGERLMGEGRGRVVLTASRGTEYSFEGEPVEGATEEGSVFTSALVEGISTGAADSDSDGYVTVDDAYAFAFEKVRQGGAQQTPQRWLYGAEGSIVLARCPPQTAPARADPEAERSGAAAAPSSHGSPPITPPPAAPASAEGRQRFPHRVRYAVVAGLVLLALIAGGALLVHALGSDADNGGGGASGSSDPVVRTFSQAGPWRLGISDQLDGEDAGCYVTVSGRDGSDPQEFAKVFGTKSFQMHRTGDLRYRASDPHCVVVPRAGPGTLPLPSVLTCCPGDSEAFKADGPIEVTMTSDKRCDLTLNAVDDGRTVDFSPQDDSKKTVLLDPADADAVYFANTECAFRVAKAP